MGKDVSFQVEYTTPNGRECGNIFLGSDNVAHLLLKNGLAKLRSTQNRTAYESVFSDVGK